MKAGAKEVLSLAREKRLRIGLATSSSSDYAKEELTRAGIYEYFDGLIVNMQRGGPGLGDIGPSQGDYFQAVKGGGHGDHRNLVLAPSTAQECYDFMFRAFALAFKYANPVMVLGDAYSMLLC